MKRKILFCKCHRVEKGLDLTPICKDNERKRVKKYTVLIFNLEVWQTVKERDSATCSEIVVG